MRPRRRLQLRCVADVERAAGISCGEATETQTKAAVARTTYRCLAPATSDKMHFLGMILGAWDMRSLILLAFIIGIAGVADTVVYNGRYRSEISFRIQNIGDDVRQWAGKYIR